MTGAPVLTIVKKMIDEKKIVQIARLARIEINQEEAFQLGVELTKAVQHFQEISTVNTEGIEPMITPTEIEMFWREDVVTAEFSAEEILQCAPSRVGNLFKVPPVVG